MAIHTLGALGVLAAATGCSMLESLTASKAATKAASLVVVQGSGQSGQVGVGLPTPIVLRALDATGAPAAGVTVSLAIQSGGGTVTPASDTTDALGQFTAKWTLGPTDTAQQIVASTSGVSPVSINATGLVPTQILLVQGNGQTTKQATAVTNSIIVRVVGPGNVPMRNVTVGFQILTGGGAMSPLTVVTDSLGQATTKWTLGAVGSNTASVFSGTLTAIALSATATP
jgi:hypothetical protein